ncbi:MAG: PaaI family thioesterase [Gemmatimonadaceae bacterium]
MTATPTLRLDESPYQRFLGLKLEHAGDGEVVIRLPFRDEFLRADDSDWLHGGVVSALIDIAGDYALVTKTGAGLPTIDMRVDWLRPARRGDLVATGRAVKVGRTVSVADVEVRDTGGELVAVGRAAYATARLSS